MSHDVERERGGGGHMEGERGRMRGRQAVRNRGGGVVSRLLREFECVLPLLLLRHGRAEREREGGREGEREAERHQDYPDGRRKGSTPACQKPAAASCRCSSSDLFFPTSRNSFVCLVIAVVVVVLFSYSSPSFFEPAVTEELPEESRSFQFSRPFFSGSSIIRLSPRASTVTSQIRLEVKRISGWRSNRLINSSKASKLPSIGFLESIR